MARRRLPIAEEDHAKAAFGLQQRQQLRATSSGVQRPPLVLGLHSRPNGRRQAAEVAGDHGRIHAGVPGVGSQSGHHRDKILDVLTNLFLMRGVPKHIRSDNGPEFIAKAIERHASVAGLEMLYVEPSIPWENGFAESFFIRLRDELLNVEESMNLAGARWFAQRRLQEHNEERRGIVKSCVLGC